MKRSKLLAVGAIAVAIGAVLFVGLREPTPSTGDTVGTIAPAERYQAPTVGPTDVQLGDQAASKFMQTDTFRMIQTDAKLAAALSSDAFRQALASDSFRQAMKLDAAKLDAAKLDSQAVAH